MEEVSLLGLLRSTLPEAEYHSFAHRCAPPERPLIAPDPPGGYQPWPQFLHQAAAHLHSTRDTQEPSFRPPLRFPGPIASEQGVRSLIYMYWTIPVEQMGAHIKSLGITSDSLSLASHDYLDDLMGWPDYIVFSGSGDEKAQRCSKVIVEAKSQQAIPGSPSAKELIASTNAQIVNALRQMYAYLFIASVYGIGSGYGVLTTFSSTWFCKLAGDAMLVSDPVRSVDAMPSFYACLWYLLSYLVYREPVSEPPQECPSCQEFKPELLLSGVPLGDSIAGRSSIFSYGDFEELGVCVQVGEHFTASQATFRGQGVTIKYLDLSQKPCYLELFAREIHAFNGLLQGLQGGCRMEPILWDHQGEVSAAEMALETFHSKGLVHGNLSTTSFYVDFGEEEDGLVKVRLTNLEGVHVSTTDCEINLEDEEFGKILMEN
ncbi:hypothetical protein SELMODRAFT_419727 [Selaginella moellendorffii]|uniref:Uncharacterized protein n=1 Tax=Selaginella moellendorffii TaxID=88036 RepID=D8S9V1_SELML|nr:hypothetical protein SELMODRAFT_419727 [Selaginella moellendorffii]